MENLANPIDLHRPPLVQFGVQTLGKLPGWIEDKGFSQPFVVADSFNASRLALLGLGAVACFDSVNPEPDTDNLADAIQAAEAANADLIIGFGGGSAMDMAKLVAVMINQGVPLSQISGPNRAPRRSAGLVQVPSTAGTGSEAGARALITDPSSNRKIATESPYMMADLAIIDPELTATVPPFVTAATGVDAMAHCTEAFTSKRSHPLIDHYAIMGIELVGRYLQRAVDDGSDMEARSGLALASFYGGICLGPVNTTAGHAISYPLGTRYNLAHGIANALILPHVLAANANACLEKSELVAQALGFSIGPKGELLGGAKDFCEKLGLDMRLRSHGVVKSSLNEMAAEAHTIRRLLDWNPVDLTVTDISDIYHAAY